MGFRKTMRDFTELPPWLGLKITRELYLNMDPKIKQMTVLKWVATIALSPKPSTTFTGWTGEGNTIEEAVQNVLDNYDNNTYEERP